MPVSSSKRYSPLENSVSDPATVLPFFIGRRLSDPPWHGREEATGRVSMRRRTVLAALAGVVGATAGCSSPPNRALPAVADGVVGSRAQEITAISLDDGAVVWQRSGDASQGISIGRETVVISGESLPDASRVGLAAFDRVNGDVRWERQIEGFDAFPSTAPVLVDRAVYYTSNASNGVVALGDVSRNDENEPRQLAVAQRTDSEER